MIQNMALGGLIDHAIGNSGGGLNNIQYQPQQTQHITKEGTINKTYSRPRSNFSSRYKR
jgi:hypothetical protein